MLEPTDVAGFLASMPREYSQAFSEESIAHHAALVLQRPAGRAHISLCETLPQGDAVLCVIAEDEPGLLALVCAALVTHHLDVRRAQVFARRVPGKPDEAVDFFWVRVVGPEAPAEVTPERIEQAEGTLTRFMGRAAPEDDASEGGGQLKFRVPTARPPAFRPTVRTPSVHFDPRSLAEGDSVLVLTAPDTHRLLLTVTRALTAEGVDIVASDVHTQDDWAHDRFTLEKDGAPLDPPTREKVVEAVEKALTKAPSSGGLTIRPA